MKINTFLLHVSCFQPTKHFKVETLKHERSAGSPTSNDNFAKTQEKSSRRTVITDAHHEEPTNKYTARTTNRLTTNTVKSKILGSHTRKHRKRSKPSDKVQHILLGKKENVEEMKKEDSIKDQFEIDDSQEPGKLQIPDHSNKQSLSIRPVTEFTGGTDALVGQVVTRPVSSDHFEKEESIKLVDSRKQLNEDDDQIFKVKQSSRVSDSLSNLGNALDDKISESVDSDKERMLPNANVVQEDREKGHESVDLRKDRLSQYSKAKADGQQSDMNTQSKNIDSGNTFLRKQQQLMHRSQVAQNGAERGEAGKQGLGSEGISKKEVNEKGNIKQAAFKNEGEKTRSDDQAKSNEQRENIGGNDIGAGHKQRANQIRPPNSRKSKQEGNIVGNKEAVKQDVDDARNFRNGAQSVDKGDALKPAGNGPQIQAPVRKSKVKKEEDMKKKQKNINQLHAPLKKPKKLDEERNVSVLP